MGYFWVVVRVDYDSVIERFKLCEYFLAKIASYVFIDNLLS